MRFEIQEPCYFWSSRDGPDKKESVYKSSRGPNAIKQFFDWIRIQAKQLSTMKQKHRHLVISNEDRQKLYATSDKCTLCNGILEDDRVVHHDHVTGKTYGLAHSQCNLRPRTQSITVFSITLANTILII